MQMLELLILSEGIRKELASVHRIQILHIFVIWIFTTFAKLIKKNNCQLPHGNRIVSSLFTNTECRAILTVIAVGHDLGNDVLLKNK